jgi:hypothetical protein
MKETRSKHVNNKARYCMFAMQRKWEFVPMTAGKTKANSKGMCMKL